MQKYLLLVFLAAASVLLQGKEVKLFFGAEKFRPHSNKFLDFTYTTPKSPLFKGKMRPWSYNPHGGPSFHSKGSNGSLPADTMHEHGILCQDTTLTIPCSNGEKYLTIWVGDWFTGVFRFSTFSNIIKLEANGKKIIDEKLTTQLLYKKYWLKNESYVFSVKDDIWTRLVKPVLDLYRVRVKVTDGKLTLKMTNLLLTALVISDTAQEQNAMLKEVEKESRRQFAERYPWKPQKNQSMPSPDAVSRARGFVVFQSHGDEVINPWTRPRKNAIRDTIRAFAAKDEQEMLRFGIIPLKEIKALTVKVGDFKGPNQSKIVTSACGDLWRERYKERGSESMSGKIVEMWRLNPMSYVFQEMAPQDCEPGTPRMFTLDMRVPADARPGNYFAPVQFFSGKKLIGTAKLQLKVLPFALNYKNAAQFNFQILQNGTQWPDYCKGYDKAENCRKVIDFLKFNKKYRFNNNYFAGYGSGVRIGHASGSAGKKNFAQTEKEKKYFKEYVDALKAHGNMDFLVIPTHIFHWYIGSGCYRNYIYSFYNPNMSPQKKKECMDEAYRIMKQFEDLLRANGIKKIYWYLSGEPDNYGLPGVKAGLERAVEAKKRGMTTFSTINGPLARNMYPPVYDFLLANFGTPISQALIDDVRKHGGQFGAHNTGDSRFQAGFHFWRMHAFSKHQETPFYVKFLAPFIYLPWNYNTAICYPTATGQLRPTLLFLNYREGRDDYLYMHTLETALKKARARGVKASNPAVLQAERFIKDMDSKINLDARYYHVKQVDAVEGTAAVKNTEWNSVSFERHRWLIGEYITALEKAR